MENLIHLRHEGIHELYREREKQWRGRACSLLHRRTRLPILEEVMIPVPPFLMITLPLVGLEFFPDLLYLLVELAV